MIDWIIFKDGRAIPLEFPPDANLYQFVPLLAECLQDRGIRDFFIVDEATLLDTMRLAAAAE